MGMARALFTSTILLLAGSTMIAGSPDGLFSSVKKKWPSKKEAFVVCNATTSAKALDELVASATRMGYQVQVFDVATEGDVDKATGIVQNTRPDFVVLLDQDSILGVNGKKTKRFIERVGAVGVPTVGTGEGLVKIGAVLSDSPAKS